MTLHGNLRARRIAEIHKATGLMCLSHVCGTSGNVVGAFAEPDNIAIEEVTTEMLNAFASAMLALLLNSSQAHRPFELAAVRASFMLSSSSISPYLSSSVKGDFFLLALS